MPKDNVFGPPSTYYHSLSTEDGQDLSKRYNDWTNAANRRLDIIRQSAQSDSKWDKAMNMLPNQVAHPLALAEEKMAAAPVWVSEHVVNKSGWDNPLTQQRANELDQALKAAESNRGPTPTMGKLP